MIVMKKKEKEMIVMIEEMKKREKDLRVIKEEIEKDMIEKNEELQFIKNVLEFVFILEKIDKIIINQKNKFIKENDLVIEELKKEIYCLIMFDKMFCYICFEDKILVVCILCGYIYFCCKCIGGLLIFYCLMCRV